MTRFIFILSVAACLTGTPFSAAPPPGSAMVDLEKAPTLLSIFNGGLRPLRVWGLEHRECEVRPGVTASFKVGGIVISPLQAAWEFKFNGDDTLRVMRGYTETAWTSAEAINAMASIERALGGDVEGMKRWLEGYPASSVGGEMWGRTYRAPDGMKVSYWFRHSMQLSHPFLATILVEWNLPRARRSERTTPLQPPPGYEDFDMRPMSARGMDPVKGSTESGSPGETHESSSAKGGSKASTEPAARRESDGSPWPWLAALGLLLAAIAIWWRARQMA